jgi:outer membrane protein OmpA-like peptidoglycan-associated protein
MRKSSCACGGGCPGCQPAGGLKISEPHDPAEVEADRMAAEVMRMPAGDTSGLAHPPVTSRTHFGSDEIHRQCDACKEEESEEPVMRKEANLAADAQPPEPPPASSDKPPSINGVIAAGGTPLDRETRRFFEPRFGIDLGHVRVHTGGDAAGSARSVRARAYTVGHDVVFAAGEWSPATTEGKRLLAHELAHVVQQKSRSATALLQRQAEGSKEEGGEEEAAGPNKSLDNSRADGAGCSKAQTGLGFKEAQPKCVTPPPQDIGLSGRHFHFCFDSDVLAAETPATVAAFAVKELERQPPDARFLVHGYSSVGGDAVYNKRLACHRANRMVQLLIDAGVPSSRIDTASKGATDEFPGGPDFNQVVVVKTEVPPELRFGQSRPDPACPKTPTNLGNVQPDPPCPDDPRNLGEECEALSEEQRRVDCGSFRFCLDSDIFSAADTPAKIMTFARGQQAVSTFTVHGFASDEGKRTQEYNLRLSCHRAKRIARELMRAGVPPEQISISGKGATTQFGDADANRAGLVRAQGPNIGPAPDIEARPKTPAQKHAVLDLALARLNTGGYRLEADAYISFWTCGRVPTVRHAVNTTHWYVEGDPGVPKYKHFPLSTKSTSGEAGGRLGLNAAVVSDDVFFDSFKNTAGTIGDVMAAMTYLSFFDKVSDEDFGTEREEGSEREKGAFHLGELEGSRSPAPDPLRNKPAPKCTARPGPTFKGTPAPGEVGGTVPTFEVNESSFKASAGPTIFLSPLPGDKGSMETGPGAIAASAKVTLHGAPQDFGNYDVGYLMTATEDHTSIAYKGGEQVEAGLPVPIRDTDGFRPREPWFSDGSFDSAKSGRVEVSMSKTMAQEMALNFQPLSGKQQGKLGTALERAARTSRYQLWLVARRRGAPLDRFSTHFLSGSRVDFEQNLDLTGKTATGQFKTSVPISGSDSRVVRFSGPVPEDLGAKETSTSNVISSCTQAFGAVEFEVDEEDAKSSANAVVLKRQLMEFKGKKVPALWFVPNAAPVDYKPVVTLIPRDAKRAEPAKFEVGLIQNILEMDWNNHYSTGEVVKGLCTGPLPMRDATTDRDKADSAFMTNEEPELAQLDRQRRQAKLKLQDTPGGPGMLDLTDNPACPGKSTGTLKRMISNSKFRTWVAARFAKDDTCLNFLHHIDWKVTYEAEANPDKLISGKLEVLSSGTAPDPTLKGLANEDCGSDYSGPCK